MKKVSRSKSVKQKMIKLVRKMRNNRVNTSISIRFQHSQRNNNKEISFNLNSCSSNCKMDKKMPLVLSVNRQLTDHNKVVVLLASNLGQK